MTTTALKFEKAVKQQLSDMEACGECYGEKCAECPSIDFFSKVCVSVNGIVWMTITVFACILLLCILIYASPTILVKFHFLSI